MDEREAVTRLKQGDIAGLEVLVKLYQLKALQVAFMTCRNYPLAEDIVQTAFLRAYERIQQFDENRSFGPWFLRSVVNDTLTTLTRQRHVSLEAEILNTGDEPESLQPDLVQLQEMAETKEVLWATLDKLSPKQRAVIVLRYYLELSEGEMSDYLECPPGTVRRRLHDARLRLSRLLPSWVKPS